MTDADDDIFRDFTEEEVESYRLWFEFLKLSDKSKWSDGVARHFGIDFFNDDRSKFEDWWPSHQYLFRKFKGIAAVEEIESVEHYLACRDDGSDPEMPVVGLFVHMWASKDDIRAAFEAILKKYHRGKPGRPAFDGTGNVYNFYKQPDNKMLEKILAAYKAKIDPKNVGLSLWEIEAQTSLIKKERSDAYCNFEASSKKDPHYADKLIALRNAQCITVGRYLTCAEEILKNIVEGRFPVYTPLNTKKPAD